MKCTSVRNDLRAASEAVRHVCESTAAPKVEGRLEGIAKQLRYVADGNPSDPEAMAYPHRGALDTIQRDLSEVIDRTDDEEAAEHLRRARRQLLLVIMSLDEGWQKQHGNAPHHR